MSTKLDQLATMGQSVWLDYIDRDLITSGRLKGLVDQGLRGVTSNPSIFKQAIGSNAHYDQRIADLIKGGSSEFEIYDELSTSDIRDAADIFWPVFEGSHGLDGYVSLEIDPRIADSSLDSIQEGERLFRKVGRPNVMIKVPATEAGYPVIEELTARGINVNATLIFSVEQYFSTAQSYINGLVRRAGKGQELKGIRSVASVFVSRLDATIDRLIESTLRKGADDEKKERLHTAWGRTAQANCRIVLNSFAEQFATDKFKSLFARGANIQRVLWGSTATKNPEFSDIKYIEELITPNTVNTIPEKTLDAFLDHGQVKMGLVMLGKEANRIFSALGEEGISVKHICAKLLDDGVVSFQQSFEGLLSTIRAKASELNAGTEKSSS